jgi:hypothetical protein
MYPINTNFPLPDPLSREYASTTQKYASYASVVKIISMVAQAIKVKIQDLGEHNEE